MDTWWLSPHKPYRGKPLNSSISWFYCLINRWARRVDSERLLLWHRIETEKFWYIKGMVPLSLFQAFSLSGRPEEVWLLTDFTPSVCKIQTPTFRSHTRCSCSLASFKFTRALHLYPKYVCSPSTEGLCLLSRFWSKIVNFEHFGPK